MRTLVKKHVLAPLFLLVAAFVYSQAQNDQNTAASGRLRITVGAGGGRLTIDGIAVGSQTPFQTYEVPAIKPGRHTVRVENDGYFPFEKELVVRPGNTTEAVLQQKRRIAGPLPVAGGGTRRETVPVVLRAGEYFDFQRISTAQASDSDVMWTGSGGSRYLVVVRQAKLALLGKALSFENINLDILKAYPFSLDQIPASDLSPGVVIGVRGNGGNYAVARIDAISPAAITMTVTTFR
jgi:hypothetical protein